MIAFDDGFGLDLEFFSHAEVAIAVKVEGYSVVFVVGTDISVLTLSKYFFDASDDGGSDGVDDPVTVNDFC